MATPVPSELHLAVHERDASALAALLASLSLAAMLGHSAVLGALLDAGAVPNPACARRALHPLAAAATSVHRSWGSGSSSEAMVSEQTAVEMCQRLLAAGADVVAACCPPHHSWPGVWLVCLESRAIQRLLLAALQQRACGVPGTFWPTFQQCSALLLLAAQADDARAYRHFAAALPTASLPSQYAALADEVVATACSGSGQRQVLRCMAEMAAAAAAGGEEAGDAQVLGPGAAAPAVAPAAAAAAAAGQLAPCVGVVLEAALAGAAQEGQAGEVALLLSAGVPATAAAVRGAVVGGQLEVLAQLLPRVAPAGLLPAQPAPGVVWAVPSGWRAASQYPCPLHTLLAVHAKEEQEALHPRSLAIAEALAAAGLRPAVYRGVVVHVEGEEGPRRVPSFDPARHDPSLQAHVRGGGRYLWLAATRPAWSRSQHRSFPPAFHTAARTLLLAAHRAHAPGGSGTAGSRTPCSPASAPPVPPALGCLPEHVLDEILHLAAYPLSAWAAVA
ncbi:hypothetical protein CHLNCDRAFT_134110 [Chlorella variabilis]|uniref:Uncharacterized protein n=1 Tax=Chlorella variabilis TaxID=554065 RepID=E1ZF10_CHLVA|nr:hypothetical protein CHLNCDRAFT_134110 [Chlorella variabilis]EFN55756.1 hypothetical protein CHLNCDRAFT_134110 [Chlorella variabilis]|eukprot:XP_005847858.1 hypothetical protein CHLNCDRAFT_134110 [Chlorella variabilis]